jgi:hypothetical protein
LSSPSATPASQPGPSHHATVAAAAAAAADTPEPRRLFRSPAPTPSPQLELTAAEDETNDTHDEPCESSEEEEEQRVEWIKNQKGGTKAACDGYFFTFHKKSKADDSIAFYFCDKRASKCTARLHLQDSLILATVNGHNHEPVGPKLLAIKMKEKMKKLATKTDKSTERIVKKACRQQPTDACQLLPSDEALKRTIRRAREKQDGHPPIPKLLRDIPKPLPERYRRFETKPDGSPGGLFLVSDTGAGKKRILIFSSPDQLRALRSVHARHLHVDGTFKIRPRMFYQVFTIHIDFKGDVVPVAYALAPSKKRSIYKKIFTELVELTAVRPTRLMADFEVGILSAAREVFDITPSACLFHLTQSIFRKCGEEKLRRQMGAADGVLAKWIRGLAGLAFLPPVEVPAAFRAYSEHPDRPAASQPIFAYFRNTYVGYVDMGVRVEPEYPPEVWSVYLTMMADKVPTRTNNAVEGYNNRLNTHFGCHHPHLWKFIKLLMEEAQDWKRKLDRLNMGERQRRKKKVYDAVDERLKKLTVDGPGDDLATFLHAVSHNLSKRQVAPATGRR